VDPHIRSGRRGEEEILDPTGTRISTLRASSPYPVAIPVPYLKTEDMILCCVVRSMTRLMGRDRWVWSNGGMLISGKVIVQYHFVRHESHQEESRV
jgi:hypothetical protein